MTNRVRQPKSIPVPEKVARLFASLSKDDQALVMRLMMVCQGKPAQPKTGGR